MKHFYRESIKIFALFILWGGFFLLSAEPVGALNFDVGDLVKIKDSTAVYYLSSDGKRYAFPNEVIYKSWFSDFSSVKTIDQEDLNTYFPLGGNVKVRPGTHLVKIQSDPKVYAVEPGGVLRWIKTENIASSLYASDWNQRVIDINVAFFNGYQIGDPLESLDYPFGSLLRADNQEYIVTESSGTKYLRKVTESGFRTNNFQEKFIVSVDSLPSYNFAQNLEMEEDFWIDASQREAAADVSEADGSSQEEANQTEDFILTLRDRGYYQAVKGEQNVLSSAFKFQAPASKNIQIQKITLSGYIDQGSDENSDFDLKADTDMNTLYLKSVVSKAMLYDPQTGENLAEVNNLESGYLDFGNLELTIEAGESKQLEVKVDLKNDFSEAANPRIAFDIKSVSDVLAYDDNDNSVPLKEAAPNNKSEPYLYLDILKMGNLRIKSYEIGSSTIIAAGEQDVSLGTLSFEAEKENFLIEKMTLHNYYSGSNDSINNVEIVYTNSQGETVNKTGAESGEYFYFDDMDFLVSDKEYLHIYADLAEINPADSGDRIRVVLASDEIFEAEGQISDESLDEDNFGQTNLKNETQGRELLVRKSYPVFELSSDSPSGQQSRSSIRVLKFKITASEQGRIYINKFTFKVETSDIGVEGTGNNDLFEKWADVNGDAYCDDDLVDFYDTENMNTPLEDSNGCFDFSVYDFSAGQEDTTPSDLQTGSSVNEDEYGDDYGILRFEFSDSLRIEKGESKTFLLYLDLSYLNEGGQNVRVSLLGDEGQSAEYFSWNDTQFNNISGYFVPGLPVSGHRLNFGL